MAAAWQRWAGRVASALRSLVRRSRPADATATSMDAVAEPRRWRTGHLAAAAGVATLLAAISAAALWWFGAQGASGPGARAPQATKPASAAAPAPAGSAAAGVVPPAGMVMAPSGAASAPIGAIAPDIRPRLGGAALRSTPTHFALVSPPIASEAEARAMLARLREATARIRHPTATETSIDRTPDGWRVSWWPFNGERQAENARAALAARRIPLEVVDF